MTGQTLADRLTVTVNGEKKELFMSAGLLGRLVSVVCPGGLDDAVSLAVNPLAQQDLLSWILAPVDEKNRPIMKTTNDKGEDEYFSHQQLNLSVEDSERIIDWAGDHLRNFFFRQVQKLANWKDGNEDALAHVSKSLNLTMTQKPSKASKSGSAA